MHSDSRSDRKTGEMLLYLVVLPCVAALGLAWLVPVANAWGWDESMHAELPAVRMLFALQDVAPRAFFEALHSCGQYPFVWPLVLALAQATLGVGEAVARGAGWVAFALLLALVHAGARELDGACGGGRPWARRIAPLFALLSPLLCAFAPTLFLEVPFALALAATYLAWLAWQRADERRQSARRALLASGLATLALFTKWNYGALLWLGFAVDLALWIVSAGASRRGARARRALWLLPLPVAALAWWFLVPLPFGAEVANAHRAAFVEFLGGNLEMASAPWSRRILDLAGYLPGSPLEAAVLLVGLLATLRRLSTSAVRRAWILFLALEIPAVAHPYHLDRFLIPGAPMLWMLAALGWSELVERRRVLLAPLVAACVLGWLTAPWQFEAAARALGAWPENEESRPGAREVVAGWVHPDVRRRVVTTGGLRREELAHLLDVLAREIGPSARVGWPAIPSEVSPAALHLGLLERGGSRERFLAEAHRKIFLSIAQTDEGLSPDQVARWAEDYEVLILTDPPDLKARPGREWLRAHVAALLASGRWEATHVADLEIARPPSAPLTVQLELARKKP
jgi:hypothetical protein